MVAHVYTDFQIDPKTVLADFLRAPHGLDILSVVASAPVELSLPCWLSVLYNISIYLPISIYIYIYIYINIYILSILCSMLLKHSLTMANG